MERIQISVKDACNLKCVECCCGDWNVVLDCRDFLCAVFSVRPKRRRDALKSKFWSDELSKMIAIPVVKKRTGRTLTEEQKIEVGKRFKKYRKN